MKAGRSLQELAAEIQRRNDAKEDFLLPPQQIVFDANDSNLSLHLYDGARHDVVEPLQIKEVAHQQFSAVLGINANYYRKMLAECPKLLATNANYWLQHMETPKGNTPRRMVRTLDGFARAFLSERYCSIDNADVAEIVFPVLAELKDVYIESCEVTDTRMYIKAVNRRLTTNVAVGDTVQAGLVISNSEVGKGNVCVEPLIYRLVCKNGMIIKDASTKRRHSGRINSADEDYRIYRDETLQAIDRAFAFELQDKVRSVVDEVQFAMIVDKMRDAKEAKLNTKELPDVVRTVNKFYGFSEEEGKGILQYLVEGNDLSLYGLSNAVTRQSQDVADYDRATELEGKGYEILTMPRPVFNRINQPERVPAAA